MKLLIWTNRHFILLLFWRFSGITLFHLMEAESAFQEKLKLDTNQEHVWICMNPNKTRGLSGTHRFSFVKQRSSFSDVSKVRSLFWLFKFHTMFWTRLHGVSLCDFTSVVNLFCCRQSPGWGWYCLFPWSSWQRPASKSSPTCPKKSWKDTKAQRGGGRRGGEAAVSGPAEDSASPYSRATPILSEC